MKKYTSDRSNLVYSVVRLVSRGASIVSGRDLICGQVATPPPSPPMYPAVHAAAHLRVSWPWWASRWRCGPACSGEGEGWCPRPRPPPSAPRPSGGCWRWRGARWPRCGPSGRPDGGAGPLPVSSSAGCWPGAASLPGSP